MRLNYFWLTLLLLFISPTTLSDGVSDCLKGRSNTPACRRMITNYWQHAPAMIAYESRYNHQAVSPVKASGLTQIMPTTALGMRVHPSQLFIPEVSIRTGARYLRQMYNQFGRLDLALAAYNAGPRRVRQAGNRVPNIAETQHYVRNVTALYIEFKRKTPSSNHTTSHITDGLSIVQAESQRPRRIKPNADGDAYQSHTSNLY